LSPVLLASIHRLVNPSFVVIWATTLSEYLFKNDFFNVKSAKIEQLHWGISTPKKSCDKCSESTWERVGMIREKKGPLLDSEKLLIRGKEESFVGATAKANELNLNSME